MSEEEIKKQVSQYRNQIIAIIFVILALLISIYVINTFIRITKYGDKNNEYKSAIEKSKISALIILITTLYFAFIAYDAYKKDSTNTNLNYLIAVILVLIAAFMRFFTILDYGQVTGAEDII